jgi:hypothetical protein
MQRPLLALALALPLISAARGDDLRAGAAAVVITPAPGTPMAGYYHERGAEGVHDDLFAKALVLESGSSRVALVALDLITTTRDLVDDARAEIGKTTKVPGAWVMISATHAHTGPVLAGNSPIQKALGGASEAARSYRAALPGKIAEAVRLAEANLQPARLSVAHGHEDSIAFNRRFHMKDGTVGWNPGKGNPKILKAAGTTDPDLPLLYAETPDGRPIGAYVNFAVHLDNVGGSLISADLPATLSRLLADYKGPELVTLFTAGCCGDVNHINVFWPAAQGGHGNAARMGTILAAEAFRSWPSLEPVAPAPLRVLTETVRLPLPSLPPDAAAKAEAVVARLAEKAPPPFMEQVDAFKTLDVLARDGKPLEVEVQVIALGDQVAWVSLPGEVFVELGLAIKQDSPFPHTIIAELANGAIGYIPSRRAYAQGNYEVVSARCAEGSGELLVDAAVRLLKQLHAEQGQAANPPE